MNNYTIIEGQTYDRRLIEDAQKLILEKSIEEISTTDITLLWENVQKSDRPSDIEVNTWRYLMTAHRFSLEAASWLRSHLPPEGPDISPLDYKYRAPAIRFNYPGGKYRRQRSASTNSFARKYNQFSAGIVLCDALVF